MLSHLCTMLLSIIKREKPDKLSLGPKERVLVVSTDFQFHFASYSTAWMGWRDGVVLLFRASRESEGVLKDQADSLSNGRLGVLFQKEKNPV